MAGYRTKGPPDTADIRRTRQWLTYRQTDGGETILPKPAASCAGLREAR
ncbi:hypothetical protein Srubr_03340 [Streptomyces rubradiris]|uniref:Uncharacterized protein n=1 Tax=Streptomyces rubradiris TaxID=285531 RepID=A0ABQ3R3T1_STRRR|nr:hypothetical protein GCM10018792_22400 [Streptomyces rubradiris]GHI50488.1 hypothetical protein Srubr_03340 [Streptomyces rubradiris]